MRWTETYIVKTKDIESISSNMPARGLAAATGAVPVQRGRESAVARVGRRSDEPALPPY